MSKDDAGVLAFYGTLPSFESTIRIFERVDDFATFGEDAKCSAGIVYRSPSATRRAGDGKTPLCTVNRNLLAALLKGALDSGHKIEIYAAEAGSRSKWSLSRQASPGDIVAIEDLMADTGSPVVCSVSIKSSGATTRVGVAFVDTLNKSIGLCEFEDNEAFGNLEALLIQLGAKEVVVSDSPSSSQVSALASRIGALVAKAPKSEFSVSAGEDLLVELSGQSKLKLGVELSRTLACAAAAALAKRLGLRSGDKWEIVEHKLDQYMRLDAAALKALNVLPSGRDTSKTQSLYGLLNRTCTQAGARLLNRWLKQPLLSVEEIERRHDQVGAFIDSPISREALREALAIVPDLQKINRKFVKGIAKLDDVVRIYQVSIRIPEFINALEDLEPLREYQQTLKDCYQGLSKLIELVETTVDLQAAEQNDYVVRPDFDDRLIDLRREKDQLSSKMKELHETHASRLNMESKLKFENTTNWGWCYRLTRGEAGCLRSHSGYVELATQKAGVYFTTKELRDCNSEWSDLDTEYKKTQTDLANQVVNITSTYLVVLGPLGQALAAIDVLVSFAEVSSFATLPYVRPKMHPIGTGSTHLKQARHPCMEAQDEVQFIPNDVNLIRGEEQFVIITGPNMGGKSTYIRQIGVIALMAQVGCYVPCDSAEICVFDCVLARVGAGDSQLKGISTFMAEMLETASILKTATPNSLIVIDELGRGTSTYDGFGLAWAISQHIITKIGCFALFATHFHELTALADKYPQACNLHVVANTSNEDDITLLYRVAPGISDKSFGIHVAEVVNFPEKVIKMAKRKAQELEDIDAENVQADQVEEANVELQKILKKWVSACGGSDEPQTAVASLREVVQESNIDQKPVLKSIFAEL